MILMSNDIFMIFMIYIDMGNVLGYEQQQIILCFGYSIGSH